MQHVTVPSRPGRACNRRPEHQADENLCQPCIPIHVPPPFARFATHGYCSSSPASENAPSAVETAAPQTALVACRPVPVLDPQTTLKAASAGVFQGTDAPQTTELPLTLAPQTTDAPQTPEPAPMLPFPSTNETVLLDGL